VLNADVLVFSFIGSRSARCLARDRYSNAPRRWPATGGLLACLLVGLLILTSACGRDSAPEHGTSGAASGSSSPATSDPADSETGPVAPPLSAADYRAALKDLVRSDTAHFELFVIRDTEQEDPDLALLPRMNGFWRLSTSEALSFAQLLDPKGGRVEVQYRLVDGSAYSRAGFDGSVFGEDCWVRIDTDAPELVGTPSAGQQFGLPAALHVFDGYRPKGRRAAGTARLDDVLGSIGFENLANTDPELFRQGRVPIDVQLEEGRLHRILVHPSDLLSALDALPGGLAVLAQMEELLIQAPLLFWAVEYSSFGQPVVLETPPASKLLDPGNPNETCRSPD